MPYVFLLSLCVVVGLNGTVIVILLRLQGPPGVGNLTRCRHNKYIRGSAAAAVSDTMTAWIPQSQEEASVRDKVSTVPKAKHALYFLIINLGGIGSWKFFSKHYLL